MEAHHRPPRHQQAMPKALYKNGDAKEATGHRQAQRPPLRLLRLEGRILRNFNSPEGPRGFHNKAGKHLLQLCALPMGWSLSPYTFPKFTDVFVNKLRDPDATARPGPLPKLTKKAKNEWLRRQRMRTGARLLPFVYDFAVYANGFDVIMRRKNETFALVNSLGLNMHPTKGYHTATQVGEHMGMKMDFEKGVFRVRLGIGYRLYRLNRYNINIALKDIIDCRF
jgi:hypothetical protein